MLPDQDRIKDSNGEIDNLLLLEKVEGTETMASTGTFSQQKHTKIWLAGMILDFDKIQPRVIQTLLSLNCDHDVGVHMLVPNKKALRKAKDDYQQIHDSRLKIELGQKDGGSGNDGETDSCAPFIIQHQKDTTPNQYPNFQLSKKGNRIDRISALRDLQREMLEKVFKSHTNYYGYDDDRIVILADLDLYKFPTVETMMAQISQLQDPLYPHDAVCAAGITIHGGGGRNDKLLESEQTKSQPEFWYYDTFATVFLPDTFAHPLKRRLIKHYYPGEDPKFVRSDDANGNFTQGDIYRYFRDNSDERQSPTLGGPWTGLTRVKSCFGGMAIYRFNSYFERKCRYQLSADPDLVQNFNKHIDWIHNHKGGVTIESEEFLQDPELDLFILRYANDKEGRPCEHVVFHDCLRDCSDNQFNIAVNPALRTFWARDF